MLKGLFRIATLLLLSLPAGVGCQAGSIGEFRSIVYGHAVSLGDDGYLKGERGFPRDSEALKHVVWNNAKRYWTPAHQVASDPVREKKRLLIFAHGGLVSEKVAVERLADYVCPFEDASIYPIGLIWHTGVQEVLLDHFRLAEVGDLPADGECHESPEVCREFADDHTERIARDKLPGKANWRRVKQAARNACLEQGEDASRSGGAWELAAIIGEELRADPEFANDFELHLVGHSAGSILIAFFLAALEAHDVPVESCTLWAPACDLSLYQTRYLPALRNGHLKDLTILGLTDEYERDDHCHPLDYEKSLLYLVSNALEENADPEPDKRRPIELLGMETLGRNDPAVQASLIDPAYAGRLRYYTTPTVEGTAAIHASNATRHGCFDDDPATVHALIRRINPVATLSVPFKGCPCDDDCGEELKLYPCVPSAPAPSAP